MLTSSVRVGGRIAWRLPPPPRHIRALLTLQFRADRTEHVAGVLMVTTIAVLALILQAVSTWDDLVMHLTRLMSACRGAALALARREE
jgi:hypothetical protein